MRAWWMDRSCGGLPGNAVEVGTHHAHVARIVEQEGIVAVGRVDLGVAHVAPVLQQGLDDLPAARGREAPVGGEAHQQEPRLGAGERQREVAAEGERRIEVVQRPRDEQVGVGVEVIAELVALVAQVALDLELDVLRAVAGCQAFAQLPPELLVHHVVRQVRDVADHARDAQPPLRDGAVAIEVPAVEVRVGDDRAARHLVERDVLRGEVGRARHHHRMAHALGVLQRPRQRLHAAQAAAQHGGELLHAQAVQQPRLGIHPVLHRHHGKVGAVHLAGIRVCVHRPGGAEARAQVVDADHEEAVRVHRLARADHVVPPALAAGLTLVHAGHVVRGIEGMAHQHRVGAVGVQGAVGFVGQRVVADRCAPLQGQRLREVHGLRCGDERHG